MADRIWQDLRQAARRFRREPGVAAAAVATIGLAVGLLTAVSSVASAVLLHPLPFTDPDRLVAIWRTMPGVDFVPVPVPEWLDLEADAADLASVGGFTREGHTLVAPRLTVWADTLSVTPNLLDMLGAPALVGRTFRPDENQPGRDKVVVLTEGFWRRTFGGDPDVVGTRVRLVGDATDTASDSYEVIGVVGWSVELSYRRPIRADAFVPHVFTPVERRDERRRMPGLLTIARLRPGVTVEQADADVRALMAALTETHAATSLPGAGARVVSLHEELVGQTRPALVLLACGVAIVFVIGFGNVANLLLASGLRRTQETAIRLALGCSRGRLLRQLLTEHALLAMAGGALGIGLASWATPLMARLVPTSLPRADQIHVNADVLAFGLVVSAAAGLVFGLAPAWVLAKPRLVASLKVGVGSVTSSGRRLRAVFVVAETALVLALLAGAALLGVSAWRVANLSLGFNPAQVTAMQIVLPRQLTTAERALVLERDLLARVRGLPGVLRAATSDELPFAWSTLSSIDVDRDDTSHFALVSAVDPDYLPLIEVPLRRGRRLGADDRGHDDVAIVNEALARLLPDGRALGQRILVARKWREIVGVAGNIIELGGIRGNVIHEAALSRLTLPAVYVPSGTSFGSFGFFLLVRTALAPAEVERSVRRELRAIDAEVTIRRTGTLDAVVATASAGVRFQMLLLWVFAGTALALAAVGLHGVLANLVGQRIREIGLRMALGASRRQAAGLVAGQAAALVGTGAAIGLAAALAGGRLIRAFLFEVNPADPLVLAAVLAVLLAVAAVATLVPALRAARIDPMTALRCE